MALVATCLTAGIAAGPAVAAAPSDGSPSAKSAQKPRATTESLRKRVVEAEEDLRNTGKGIRFLLELSKRNENAVKFLTAAAPQLVNGLTSLRDASLQLKAGLETLGAAYTSVEYGAVKFFEKPAGSDEGEFDEIEGLNINSFDIPDDGNTATVSGSVPFQATGPTDIVIRGTIRSNEIEPGTSQGEMGGILFAKCAATPRVTGVGPGGPVFAATCGPGIPSGATVCVLGPPDERRFTVPDGSTQESLVPITGSAPRTDRDRPTRNDKSPTGDDDEVCTLPGPGVYELSASVQFADIPDSRTPGPRE